MVKSRDTVPLNPGLTLCWILKKTILAWNLSYPKWVPYHFDPDPGCEKIRYGSGSSVNFDTDPDPGKNDTDPDPARKYQENLQKVYEKRSYPMFCGCSLSTTNHSN